MAKSLLKRVSWIEWCIIALVMGGLLAITLPAFKQFQCRAMQSEAKYVLGQLYTAQQFFHGEHGEYTDLTALMPPHEFQTLPVKRYVYSLAKEPTDKEFTLVATGQPGTPVEGDTWHLNHRHDLMHVTERCE